MYNALCIFKLNILYLCSCMAMYGYTMDYVGCNVACICVTPSYSQSPTYNRKNLLASITMHSYFTNLENIKVIEKMVLQCNWSD